MQGKRTGLLVFFCSRWGDPASVSWHKSGIKSLSSSTHVQNCSRLPQDICPAPPAHLCPQLHLGSLPTFPAQGLPFTGAPPAPVLFLALSPSPASDVRG